ncbi:hypothetical protein ACH4M4_19755 [Streptomyces sp. NPDC017254]|uniref:hypothetical protein n=1 Tax=unclassified Streptomyces TaxID=2593676 RepID=UPI0037B15809
MSGHFTDRDERMWQQRAEERATRPLPLGTWLRALRSAGWPTGPVPTVPVEARVLRGNARTPAPGRRGPTGTGVRLVELDQANG